MRRRGRAGEERSRPPEPALILSGRGWVHGRLAPLDVGLDDAGRIVRIGRDLRGPRRRDLGEQVLVPSGVDLHVHFRDPGPPGAAETIASGTIQAVLGGVATVGEMPNTEPPVTSVDRLESKAARVRGRAACDVLLYAAAVEPRAIRAMGRLAGGFKLYTGPTTNIEAPAEPARWPELLEAARATDLPVAVHAEDPSRFRGTPADASDLDGWSAHRPPEAEGAAARAVAAVAGTTRLHVAHVTTAPISEDVVRAGYSHEASPHHLLLSTATRHRGALAKVNPPLRSEGERAALFERFRSGAVPVLASDHAPHPPEAKSTSFGGAASGIAGVETMLPVFLALVARGDLSLGVLQSASADRPARWLGLPCGRLWPGHSGHLYVVDFRARSKVRSRALHGSGTDSPFEGFEAVFPTEHYVGGNRVVEDGEYIGSPTGRTVRPEYAR